MRVKPIDDPVEAVEQVFLFSEAVAFARIKHKLGIDFVVFQGTIELLALADRIGSICLALKKERGSAHVLRIGDRRASDKPVLFFVGQPVEPFVVSGVIFRAELACEIDDRRSGNCRFESIRLRYGPRAI